MATNLRSGKTKIIYCSEQLSDNFFKFDSLASLLRRLLNVILSLLIVLVVVAWMTSDFSFSLLINKPIFWLGAVSAWHLFAQWQMSKEKLMKIHRENLSTEYISDIKREKIDVLQCLSKDLRDVLRSAYRLFASKKIRVNGVSIAYAIIGHKSLKPLLARLAISPVLLQQKLIHVQSLKGFSTIDNITDLLPAAYETGFKLKAEEIGPGELLSVLIDHDMGVREVFLDSGIDSDMIKNILAWQYYDRRLRERTKLLRWKGFVHPRHHLDRAMTAIETPLLNQVGSDMTELSAKGYYLPAVERPNVTNAVFEIMSDHNSAILVGEPGVGKRRFLELLAEHMVTGNVPSALKDKRLVNISIGQLISGADTAAIAQRVQRLFYEALSAGNAILVIEDIHGLSGIQAGRGESVDVASIVADAIQRSGITLIGTSTPSEYRESLQGSALGEILKKIEIPEPDTQTAIRIVETRAHVAEIKHQVYFTYSAIARLVEIAQRYIHDRYLPRKATEHLDRLALETKQKKSENFFVTAEIVNYYMENQLHLPLQQSNADESKLLLQLEEILHKDIVGQDQAISVVANALRRTRAGIASSNRPIAVLLFMGPTGVGKTALAKSLAKQYFKDKNNILRLDMSEYQGPDGVSKLIGDKGESSLLISSLREKPFQVILLDEFEKADLEVRNLFLQVFDDARLSDGTGKTADFTNTIIIATSNAGGDMIQRATAEGLSNEEIDKLITEEVLRKNFSPELLNRFDDTVIFHPLTENDVKNIAKLIIKEVQSRLETKGINLAVSESAVAELSVLGFDRRFGARPLRRAIQENLEAPLAQIILKGEALRRDTIFVDNLNQIRVKRGEIL